MKKRITFGLAIVASSAAMTLQAQDEQETMVVVGSRTPTQISQIPGAVWMIEKEELQQQIASGGDLKAALGRLVPGLDMAPQGRTNYGQNLRGRTAQVLIDGVSMNSSRGLSRQFDAIDPFNIERIEVVTGASSLYGGGATGGIINIITRKGRAGGPDWRTEAGVTTGFNRSDDFDKRIAQSVSGGNERVQAHLGTAFQDNGRQFDASGDELFPDIAQTDLQDNRSIDVLGNLTGRELIGFGRYPWHGLLGRRTQEDKKAVERAIELSHTEAFADRLVDTLSGGERQRVWLAMLLAQQSRFLLLDEPLAALDIAHQMEVLALIRRLCDELRLGVIIVLHDINMASRYCDELLALHSGQVLAHGSPQEIMTDTTLEAIYGLPMQVIPHPSGEHRVAFAH